MAYNPPEDAKEILSSITVGYYYQEGTYTLLSSYIESLAQRKNIELTFESSRITIIVKKNSSKTSSKTNKTPEEILNEASYIALKIASEVAQCSAPSSWNLLSYSGKVSTGKKYVKYTRIGRGIFSAFVTYENENKTYYLSLKLKVSCYRNVLVLKKPVFYGQTVYPDDLEYKRVDILQIISTPASTEDAYYSKARKTLKVGEILTLDSIKRKPDVIKGEILIAFVELPGIYITVMVEALQEGYIGDTIRVKNLTSGKILKGVLLKDKRVKVLEVER
ncbi:MAG: flagellar basal body P-ring formation protein FlgA [Thermotogaceae bacterium]|nr:flagellar basal body P-ring formation protein FlgA [Thermotogaceae bacterium]